MARLASNALELIGDTPPVRLHGLVNPTWALDPGKLELLNPGGSVEGRLALATVEEVERQGWLKPGDAIVEPTSGNTGIGLAMVAAVKGYRLIVTMPEDMSVERRALLQRDGAELVFTPAIEGMAGALCATEEPMPKNQGCFMPQPLLNPANPAVHRQTTLQETLKATGGHVDAFVIGGGTGGPSLASGGC